MNYYDARPLISSGDMLLWRDHPSGSQRSIIERWIVRHVCASPYTHVGVALVQNGRVSVMDITTKGCAPRLLSSNPDFDWAPAPKVLSQEAIDYAASCWGEWEYSRWQCLFGFCKRLVIGADTKGECAEYAISIWRANHMAPTDWAIPGACADGALKVWKSEIIPVIFTIPNP